jgi:hypothetical protein
MKFLQPTWKMIRFIYRRWLGRVQFERDFAHFGAWEGKRIGFPRKTRMRDFFSVRDFLVSSPPNLVRRVGASPTVAGAGVSEAGHGTEHMAHSIL